MSTATADTKPRWIRTRSGTVDIRADRAASSNASAAPHDGGFLGSTLPPGSTVHPEHTPWIHRFTYPILGVSLAIGAPAGLLLLRAALAGHPPWLSWIEGDLASQWITYAYLVFSSSTVLGILGWFLGRREDTLEASSATDPLTGLWNRRHLTRRLEEELSRARRYRGTLSLLLVDVDRLKRINDQLGHEAGDTALQIVSDTLRATCRATDVIARVGGDEFVIVAPETDGAAALELGERIRSGLGSSGRPVSVSIGIADLNRCRSFAPSALYESADAALYEAKACGRDCSRLAAKSGR